MADFSDDFNRADGELGANWTVAGGAASISSNVCDITTAPFEAVYNTAPSSADCYAQATINEFNEHQVACRATSNFATLYLCQFRTLNSDCLIYRKNSGTWNLISTTTSITVPTTCTVKIEVTTTDSSTVNIKCYLDGTEKVSYNDTHADRITSTNYCGVRSSSTSATIDDFEGGVLGGDPPAATFIPRVTMF